MFKIQYIIGASALAVSSLALATSDIIRQDQENECAIYLCLPTGFSASECKTPHKRFIERMTDINWRGLNNYTPLPNFIFCKNDENSENNEIDNAYSQLGQNAPESLKTTTNIGYTWRIDAKVPEHRECTGWSHSYICTNGEYPGKEFSTRAQAERKCSRNSNHPSSQDVKELTWCSSWKTVAKHYVENSYCYFGNKGDNFVYDDHQQKVDSYNSPKWCDRTVHVVGVTMDGQLYGNYYRQGDDENPNQNTDIDLEQEQEQNTLKQNTELELKQAEEISNRMNDTSVQNQDNDALLKDLQEELKNVELDH